MKKMLMTAIVLTFALAAGALTLKEKKQVEEWNAYLTDASKSYVKTAKDKCGYDIPVKMDEAMATPFMAANANAASYCDEVRSTISGMCDDKTSKDAIKAKIKSINCHLGKKPTDVEFTIKSGVLDFAVGVNGSNLSEKTKTFLENNL